MATVSGDSTVGLSQLLRLIQYIDCVTQILRRQYSGSRIHFLKQIRSNKHRADKR
jgi:hypothetical protein